MDEGRVAAEQLRAALDAYVAEESVERWEDLALAANAAADRLASLSNDGGDHDG